MRLPTQHLSCAHQMIRVLFPQGDNQKCSEQHSAISVGRCGLLKLAAWQSAVHWGKQVDRLEKFFVSFVTIMQTFIKKRVIMFPLLRCGNFLMHWHISSYPFFCGYTFMQVGGFIFTRGIFHLVHVGVLP